MPDTIKIPGIGPMDKKYAIIGAAGIAGFVGFAYYRSRSAVTEDTSTTDTTDTTATDSTAFDPAYDYSAYGDSGYSGGSPVYYPPYGSSQPVGTGNPTSDPEWNQKAYETLVDRGIESSAASHALSRFMANLCLTQQEADYVRQAIGAIGDTPQAHHTIQICPDAPGPPANTATTPTGFRVAGTDKSGVSLSWTPVTGAQSYIIHIGGGKLNHSIITRNASTYRFGALKKSTTYTFNIKAVVDGKESPASGNVSGKTKSK